MALIALFRRKPAPLRTAPITPEMQREMHVLACFTNLLAERGIDVQPGDPSLMAFPEFASERARAYAMAASPPTQPD